MAASIVRAAQGSCRHIEDSSTGVETTKAALQKIMLHMREQVGTQSSLSVSSKLPGGDVADWDMRDGIYIHSFLVSVNTNDFDPNNFVFRLSLEIQTIVYHLYRLRQARLDHKAGVRNYAFDDGSPDGPVTTSWYEETRRYLRTLSACLEREEKNHKLSGTWDLDGYNLWASGKRRVALLGLFKELDPTFCVTLN